MSQYGQVPPPGVYGSPNPQQPQAPAPNPYQSGTYQPPQNPSTPNYGAPQPQPAYGPQAGNYGGTPQYGGQQQAQYGPSQSHAPQKSGFSVGKMYDQAVTTGKPMYNKLGKMISSKLGNKQSTQTPQHLQSYGDYQQHQQWGQQPQQQPQYGPAAIPHPGVPPQFASPASSHSGQSNYFPQQGQQPVSQPPSQPNYGPNTMMTGQQTGVTQSPQSPNVNTPPHNPLMGAPGVPPHSNQPPVIPSHPNQPQQPFNTGTPNIPQHPGFDNAGPPSVPQHPNQPQQQQTFSPGAPTVPQHPNMPPQQISTPGTPSVPQHPNQQQQQALNAGTQNVPQQGNQPPQQQQYQQHQQQQQQVPSPGPHQQEFVNAAPPPPQYSNTPPPQSQQQLQQLQQSEQPQQSQQQPSQHGHGVSPIGSPAQAAQQVPPSASPPPGHHTGAQQQQHHQQQPPSQPQSPPPQQQAAPQPQPQRQESIASSHNSRPQSAATTNFVAELPSDFGNMNISEGSKPPGSTNSAQPPSQYQAYQPPGPTASSGSGFAIPRRAVSTSSLPLADPWRVADPSTELPTREFYIIADLIFDALDRRYEPVNTGLLEASKMLESWRAQQLPEEVAQLFQYDSYTAFAKLWSLEGIPHIMVPFEAHLRPQLNFEAQAHGHLMRIPNEFPPAGTPYPRYIPALNRAGWYKCLFLEVASEPEALSKMLPLFCSDTYRPGILQHPDVQKQDKSEIPSLANRARSVRTLLERVCQETAAAMQGAAGQQAPQGSVLPSGVQHSGVNDSQQNSAAQYQAFRMQQQITDTAYKNAMQLI